MNKSDIKLIVVLISASLLILLIFLFFKDDNKKNAIVYYDGNMVMSIDLSIDSDYEVMGYNGMVYLNVVDGKIRVLEENSPYHICSKQGFISKSYESIVCLPNKIVINIDNNELDAVVK